MKNNALRIALALGAACVCASALDAQSYDFSAKVPFGFQVSGQAFPAGKYIVLEHGDARVPQVQNARTGLSVFVFGASHSLTHAGAPRLVFHCYAGNACFLAEIRPASDSGIQVSMTRAEKEIVSKDQPHEMATVSIDLRRAD